MDKPIEYFHDLKSYGICGGEMMEERIPLPTIKEFLYDDFMEPLGISASAVAKKTGLPVSRIQSLLRGN